MKKFVILFVFSITLFQAYGQLGYKAGTTFRELYPDNSSLFFVQTKDAEQMKRLLKDTINRQSDNVKIIAKLSDNACIVNSRSFGEDYYMSDIYKNQEGHKLIVLPRIAIKMKDGYEIEDVLTKFSQTVVLDKKKINVYLVDCQAKRSETVLSINNEISTQEGVEWCEPMIIGEAWKNSFEYLQYYIKNIDIFGNPSGVDINVEPVWNLIPVDTTIVVAVLDDGVERNHEDLVGSVLDGMSIYYPNEKGDPINEIVNYQLWNEEEQKYEIYYDLKEHGTACAGIIAARSNDIGIRGVASGTKILPINIDPLPLPLQSYPTTWYEEIGDAINWAYSNGNADIISCSWSFVNNEYVSNALNNAMNYGRNGKGTVVVCAAGNSQNGPSVTFPADMSRTIAVGAVDSTGLVWNYSSSGPELDLVAPSGDGLSHSDIVTTDRMGTNGYNPNITSGYDLSNMNYTRRFSGTSASCPQVAGVVALMLSYNASLTVDSIINILHNTAYKLPGMNGLNRTDTYGYGLVDAYAAVCSINHSISGAITLCDTATYVITGLSSTYTISWSINNSDFAITPSGNQCFVEYTGLPQYSVANLTATISWQGHTIKTLTKRIVMHGALYVTGWQYGNLFTPNGTYPDREFTIPANNGLLLSRSKPERLSIDDIFAKDKESLPINFTEDVSLVSSGITPFDVCGYGITEINGGNTVYLNSTRFDGMDISFSGTHSPSYYYRSGNYVEFEMPYNGVEYYTKLHAQSDSECHDFCLMFKVVPLPGAASGDDEIWVNLDGSMLYITFMGGSGGYSVTISKIPSGTQVYSNTFPGNQSSFSVNTSSWTSGIYSIRIVQGNNVYTKSIYL